MEKVEIFKKHLIIVIYLDNMIVDEEENRAPA